MRRLYWRVTFAPPPRDSQLCLLVQHSDEHIAKFDGLLDIAEAQLGRGTFLAGSDFTLADILFGHLLFRYFDIPIPRRDRPVLRRYYDALTARPAFREHVMVSYDDLRVPG